MSGSFIEVAHHRAPHARNERAMSEWACALVSLCSPLGIEQSGLSYRRQLWRKIYRKKRNVHADDCPDWDKVRINLSNQANSNWAVSCCVSCYIDSFSVDGITGASTQRQIQFRRCDFASKSIGVSHWPKGKHMGSLCWSLLHHHHWS